MLRTAALDWLLREGGTWDCVTARAEYSQSEVGGPPGHRGWRAGDPFGPGVGMRGGRRRGIATRAPAPRVRGARVRGPRPRRSRCEGRRPEGPRGRTSDARQGVLVARRWAPPVARGGSDGPAGRHRRCRGRPVGGRHGAPGVRCGGAWRPERVTGTEDGRPPRGDRPARGGTRRPPRARTPDPRCGADDGDGVARADPPVLERLRPGCAGVLSRTGVRLDRGRPGMSASTAGGLPLAVDVGGRALPASTVGGRKWSAATGGGAPYAWT